MERVPPLSPASLPYQSLINITFAQSSLFSDDSNPTIHSPVYEKKLCLCFRRCADRLLPGRLPRCNVLASPLSETADICCRHSICCEADRTCGVPFGDLYMNTLAIATTVRQDRNTPNLGRT